MVKKLIFSLFFSFLFLVVQPLFPNSSRVWGTSSDPYWLGWFTGGNTPLSEHNMNGVNLVAPFGPRPSDGRTFDQYLTDYLNQAQANNIKVIVPTYIWSLSTASSSLGDYINKYKDYPALFGWYLADEPNCPWASPPRPATDVISEYKTIKENDSIHPAAIAFSDECPNAIDTQRPYYPALDIIMVDYYPFLNQSGHIYTTTQIIKDHLQEAATYKKGFMMILQGTDINSYRTPALWELRYSLYTSIIRDTSGTLFYADYEASNPLKQNINNLFSETKPLNQAIKNGVFNDPVIFCINGNINYRFGSDASNYYLIAVNESNTNFSQITFNLPSYANINQIEVVNENRTRQVANRQFTDAFTGYGVHVYKFTSTIINSTPTPTITPTPLSANVLPVGWFDAAACDIFYGWACDNSNSSAKIEVRFLNESGGLVGSTSANKESGAGINAECGGTADHLFVFSTPNSLKDGTTHTINVYAIDLPTGEKKLLSGNPKQITCAPPVASPTPPLIPGDFNGDRLVNGTDFDIFLDNYGKSTNYPPSDFNKNGVLDTGDYSFLVSYAN